MHSLWSYLSYGNTPSNNSIFSNVKKIQYGEILELNLNNFEINRGTFGLCLIRRKILPIKK